MLAGILDVWCSALGEGVAAYLGAKLDAAALHCGVVVQAQVDSAKSGVGFTANPRNGCAEEFLIEAVFGQGEGLVSGLITPDQYWMDVRRPRAPVWLRERVSDKEAAVLLSPGNAAGTQLSSGVHTARVLCRAELRQLVLELKRVADHFGQPCDVEFCYDGGGVLYVLQARPITTAPAVAEALRWAPPDAGAWERNSHTTRPIPPVCWGPFCRLFDGLTPVVQKWGVALGSLRPRFLNGLLYNSMCPLGVPEPAPPTPPPGPVLWLAARLHPTLIAANSRALKSLETRPWLACVDEWRTRDKPKMDAAALELGAVDLAALSDEGVAAHCEACVAHLEAAYYSHGALTPGPMFGLALLLHRYGAYADDRELVEAATDAREAWDHSAERPLRRLACCMAT